MVTIESEFIIDYGKNKNTYLCFPIKTKLGELLLYRLSSIKPLHPAKHAATFRNKTIIREYINKLEVVALTTLVIVGVVGGSNLNGAGSKVSLNKGVLDNRKAASLNKGVCHIFSMQVFVPKKRILM